MGIDASIEAESWTVGSAKGRGIDGKGLEYYFSLPE
jgi:hypothetical protein